MPSKVNRDENNVTGHISQQISKDLKKAHSNVMIISPYFIPSDEMLTHIKTLRKSGVEVSIITNSLASTDVFPVYAGYKDYIKPLLKMGVKLYELKPDSFQSLIKSKKVKKVPNLSLHTKMILVDNKKLAVGSANIDPRSDKLNTELFMVIISKKLTGKQQKYINKVINLKNLYELNLTKHPKNKNSTTKTDIVWKTIEDGKIKYYYSAPKVGFFKKLGTDMVSILPIKGYL
jgi:putative cardiolipin synthase